MPKNMERVSPWILSLESIYYLGTSEYLCENFNCDAINWSGVVNVYSMQISLVMSTWFILVMIEMTHHVHHIFGLWQWCNFSWLDFIHTYSIILKNDIKRKYSEEYSTVKKVLFCVELIPSWFISSPNKRDLMLFLRAFLLCLSGNLKS